MGVCEVLPKEKRRLLHKSSKNVVRKVMWALFPPCFWNQSEDAGMTMAEWPFVPLFVFKTWFRVESSGKYEHCPFTTMAAFFWAQQTFSTSPPLRSLPEPIWRSEITAPLTCQVKAVQVCVVKAVWPERAEGKIRGRESSYRWPWKSQKCRNLNWSQDRPGS